MEMKPIFASIQKRNFLETIAALTLIFLLTACNNNAMELPGYVEGKFIYLSSEAQGILKFLFVRSGDTVKAGTLLFTLDPSPEEEEMEAAQARLAQASADHLKLKAAYTLQKSILDRKQGLYQKKVIAKEEFDSIQSNFQQANSALSSSEFNILALKADLKKKQWLSQQKQVRAPVDALVYDTYYQVGENIPSNNPVVALLPQDNVKVIFYIPERDLSTIKLNQGIEIQCDNCGPPIKARISFISPKEEFTPPIQYDSTARSKLSYRVEALPVHIKGLSILHPGQPVTVRFKKTG